MQKLSCVIPAYNEEESLPHLKERLWPILDSLGAWELIIVSDGSTDATVKIVTEWAQADSRVKLVALRRNQGKSAALMAGFAAATGDRVVTLDADLQDDPDEVPAMLKKIETEDLDMVGGWKQNRQDPFFKLVSSKIFNGTANWIMGTNFHDLNCGLKAYRKEVVETLDLYGDLYRFIPLLAVAQGWRVAEMPVKHHPRQWGVSKYGLRLNGLFDLISLLIVAKYRWKPLHFFGRWGLGLLAVGGLMLAWLIIEKISGEAIGDRPLLIFAVLFVMSGLQLLFTGLLADLFLAATSRKK